MSDHRPPLWKNKPYGVCPACQNRTWCKDPKTHEKKLWKEVSKDEAKMEKRE